MTKHHWWHHWSDWTKPDFDLLRLIIVGYQGQIKIQYRRCINCAVIQFREIP